MQNSESGIPVLTEVLQTPAYGIDLPERRAVPRLADTETPAVAESPEVMVAALPLPPMRAPDQQPLMQPPMQPQMQPLMQPLMQTLMQPPSQSDQELTPAALARLERDVSEAVLQRLLGQLDLVLEAHIRDRLADVLQTAVDGLACDLRHGLKQALGESISLAVAQELNVIRNTKIENSI